MHCSHCTIMILTEYEMNKMKVSQLFMKYLFLWKGEGVADPNNRAGFFSFFSSCHLSVDTFQEVEWNTSCILLTKPM